MSNKRIALLGLAQALGTISYVVLVVLILVSELLFDASPDDPGRVQELLTVVSALLMFVVSACITGSLVLGYAAILALRQQIRDAVLLVAATVGWLVVMMIIVVGIAASGLVV
jgi:hypothetical protein